MKIYIFLLSIMFPVCATAQTWIPSNPKTSGRFQAWQYQQYLHVAVGTGIYYQANQNNLEPANNPIDISIELGRVNRALNYTAGFTFAGFSHQSYNLKPRMINLGLKYAFKGATLPKWFEPYINLGIAGWETVFEYEDPDQVVASLPVSQKDQGLAAYGRIGADFIYRGVTLTPYFAAFLAQDGDYIDVSGNKILVNPGFYYLGLQIGYRLPYEGIPLVNRRIKTLSRVK